MDEVSCLVTIFKDVGWLVVENAAREDGARAGVGVRE